MTGMARGRPFEKGVSGNPNGRPKGTNSIHEIRTLARAHCPDAIATLAKLMNDPNVTPTARIFAATVLLEKGYGRALVQTADRSEGANIFVIGVPVKANTSQEWADSLVTVDSASAEHTEQIDMPTTSQEWFDALNGRVAGNGHSIQDYLPAPTGSTE
jgi:hypothetical protein